MPEKKELAEERLKIIKPFFSKEKKLKDIENESKISYATLKRWVKSYKEKGLDGLEKKSRNDKDLPKKIDDTSLKIIKKIHKENCDLSISKLYNTFKNKVPNVQCDISYPTFYRIINNLDSFVKNSSIYHIKKIANNGSVLGMYQQLIYCPNNNIHNSIFYLTLFFDMTDYKIINYNFDSKKQNFQKLFPFIWSSIIKSESYPKKIYISENIKEPSKKIFRECFFKTQIEFSYEEFDHNSIKKFCNYLENDLLRKFSINKNTPLEIIDNYVKKYFFHKNDISKSIEFLERNNFPFNNLDFFLLNTKRKVYNYGVRLKNNIYTSKNLENILGEIVNIKYSPTYNGIIYIYYKNSFFCQGILQKNQED
ncbi:helix-turn-helix domain-containing protein [Cetobacterium ceti]